ncbi:hypothetical protein L873DRAFT_1124715 [Choiromyces venosus 120613-1]|uniref:Uncharacterized protein n=1 Tax=Choiromyces venosus 120613-1 TaxID=1336337 RepID=A0A3N4JGB0_9PEZI|nr:hypothetical protein L873DRAFT_1124715 [Choiromyces venosus 120613-1]
MAPLVFLLSLRQGIAEWLSNSRKDATIASRVYEKGGIDSKTARLKKSPSLLFRLWNTVSQSQSPPKPFQVPEEETPLITRVEEEILVHEFGSHPLQPYYAPASKVKKQRESLLYEASVLRFWGIIHDDTVMLDMTIALDEGLLMDSRVVVETVAPDMIAGRRWEGDYFKECGKNVNPRIGLGEINIDEFPISREYGNPRLRHLSGFQPLKSLERRERVVSWTDSIQEYAGALGHVCHSGERPVSDCFRSLTTKEFGDENTAPGTDINLGKSVRRIPTLSLLSSRTGFGQRPQFEQDHKSLMDDWETAMRLMDEFSSAERSGRCLKRKKKILGIRDQSIFKGKNPAGEPLDRGYQQLGDTSVEDDVDYSSGEDDPSDYEALDSTDDEY